MIQKALEYIQLKKGLRHRDWQYTEHNRIQCVIVYPSWSGDQRFFYQFCDDVVARNTAITITIIDIDTPLCRELESLLGIIFQGKCEFLLLQGESVVYSILEHDTKNYTEKLDDFLAAYYTLQKDQQQ